MSLARSDARIEWHSHNNVEILRQNGPIIYERKQRPALIKLCVVGAVSVGGSTKTVAVGEWCLRSVSRSLVFENKQKLVWERHPDNLSAPIHIFVSIRQNRHGRFYCMLHVRIQKPAASCGCNAVLHFQPNAFLFGTLRED